MWLQRLRKDKHTVEYSDLLGIYALDTMADGLITKDTASRVRDLLSGKDNRTQKIVNMRVEGYSFAEISQEVKISESSARVIDFRTKKWIITILNREGRI